MEKRTKQALKPIPVDPDRPLGEKLRTSTNTEILAKPKLKDARILGDKLLRINPLANKIKLQNDEKVWLSGGRTCFLLLLEIYYFSTPSKRWLIDWLINLTDQLVFCDHDFLLSLQTEEVQLDLVKILKSLGTFVKGKYVKDPVSLCKFSSNCLSLHVTAAYALDWLIELHGDWSFYGLFVCLID